MKAREILAVIFLYAIWPAILLMSSAVARAAGTPQNVTKVAVCQIGTKPQLQVPWFRLGCQRWLKENGFQKGLIHQDPQQLMQQLDKLEGRVEASWGYVGHWDSTESTIGLLGEFIVPLLERNRRLTVRFDNTACFGVDNPYKLLAYFKAIPDVAPRLSVRANQNISIGLWDELLKNIKGNFWSVVDGRLSEPIFPDCTEFLGQRCTQYQVKGSKAGVCRLNSSSYIELICSQKNGKLTWNPPTAQEDPFVILGLRLPSAPKFTEEELRGDRYFAVKQSYAQAFSPFRDSEQCHHLLNLERSFKSVAEAEAHRNAKKIDARIELKRRAAYDFFSDEFNKRIFKYCVFNSSNFQVVPPSPPQRP